MKSSRRAPTVVDDIRGTALMRSSWIGRAQVRKFACCLAALVIVPASSLAQRTDRTPDADPPWCAKVPRAQNASLERVRVPSTWFTVYRVDRDVYAIAEPRQWQEVISYLVVGGARALLFDTGMGIADIRAVVTSLTSKPLLVLNSHSHFDHVGGNHAFNRVLSLNLPYTRTHARGLPHAATASEVAPTARCGEWPTGFDTAAYRSRPWRITETVRDGSGIDLGGRTLEVLHIPGHAPDAVALLDRANGLLLTGDTFYEGPIYVFSPGADFGAYAASVERLAALAPLPRKLLTAHNVAVSSPMMLDRLREAVRAIAAGRVLPKLEGRLYDYGFEGFSIQLPVKP